MHLWHKCLLLGLGAGLFAASAAAHEGSAASSTVSREPWLGVIAPAPDFVLADIAGKAARLSEERGRVVLMSFLYTHCPSACPLIALRLARLNGRLAAGRLEERVRILSIALDPERDTAEALASYAGHFKARAPLWRFLRAERAALAPVLAAYGEWTRTLANGELDHPARLYLIDARGRIREVYSLAFFDEQQAFLDIRALLQEAP